MKQDKITDYDIQALVDNELDSKETNYVLHYIAKEPSALNRYKELIEQKILLNRWWNLSQN